MGAETGEITVAGRYNFPADPTGIGLHNVLWGSMSSMGAMTSMTWWWDHWVGPNRLYHHFSGIRKFVGQIAWQQYSWAIIGPNAPKICTDKNPDSSNPPKYTCKQQASFGKCDGGPNGTNPWMKGMCCKTCHPHSVSACEKCSNSLMPGEDHQATDLGSGARAFGMAGVAVGAGKVNNIKILVAWI